jgi:PAS domain S-box-containing protein
VRAVPFALLAIVWVAILRRRVADQAEIIRAQLHQEANSEQRWRDLLDGSSDLVFSVDGEGRVLAVNRTAEEVTGRRRAELLAATIFDLIAEPRRDQVRRALAGLAAGGEAPPPFETELVARDGQPIPVELGAWPAPRDGRAAGGADVLVRDLSARKRAEAELGTAELRVMELARRAGMADHATGLLHDVGNVLTSVNASVSLIADRLRAPSAGPAEERQALLAEVDSLRAKLAHVQEIVRTQQGYARAPGGAAETLAASALVDGALRIHAASSPGPSIEVQRELTGGDAQITVEKYKAMQILINLLANAASACAGRAGAPGRITVRVDAEARGRVSFVVADDGVGIAPENLGRVFQHGFTTRQDGHGFGLASAALAARELGGTLTAQSDGPGRGATFTLELPLAPPGAEARRRPTRERLQPVGAQV